MYALIKVLPIFQMENAADLLENYVSFSTFVIMHFIV